MTLSATDRVFAYKAFQEFAKLEFAYTIYETKPVENSAYSSISVPTSVAMPQTIFVSAPTKRVEYKPSVHVVDQDLFVKALEKFLELSQDHTFNILQTEDLW